jgi:coenzyme F420-0:L-glutamate ligase/coenzyme F420-1:gamma-L-glutamate ligase
MNAEYQPVADVIRQRRSVRQFAADPVDRRLVRELIALACLAPAPHHSRPWRWAHVASKAAGERLADAMSESWLADLRAEGVGVREIDRMLARSRSQITDAPVLILACLELDESKGWPDERRRFAERDMFVQSLGAALQNLLLAAVERGLVGYIKGAPLFCGRAITEALDLPPAWEPTFLVLLGYPQDGHEPPPREPMDIGDVLLER